MPTTSVPHLLYSDLRGGDVHMELLLRTFWAFPAGYYGFSLLCDEVTGYLLSLRGRCQ
jgi:hypothetical protein